LMFLPPVSPDGELLKAIKKELTPPECLKYLILLK
jgi:hypothetical protein